MALFLFWRLLVHLQRLWGWGLIAFILALCTFGFSWLMFPFFANGHFAASLQKNGYLSKEQRGNRSNGSAASTNAVKSSSGVADELAKLADLKEKGILSDAEFAAQKAKVLG